ncbi:MFHAS1 [Branchiostoma lanceolatum]|uniref:Leucine-rich repeat protein SHOC-2 n=1 Tax=Branchiostoma lanceolatum TaxID=7740 RepID=A0A8J9YSH0_BRALA|nr:MFHAS1 [Branchiostoma lanceolatum]
MATPSSLRNNMKRVKWYMMGKETTFLTLDLYDQHLSQLPDELFELNELEALKLDKNKDIRLSEKLIRLTNLKALSLNGCNLDTVPAVVMKLQQLETLFLGYNRNITLPDEMSSLVNLTYLDLYSCDLKSVPAVVMKISQLKWLRLSNNEKIKLPEEMSSLVNLAYLNLANCNLDTLPPVVPKLLNLQELDLSYNKQISLPDELCRLGNMKVLKLRDCNLVTVPPAVLKLPQLEELDLGGNSGIHLPDELAGLTNLRVLKLNNTNMVTVPPVLWRLTQLEWLGLRDNALKILTAEVGQLTNVKHLDLSWCKLHKLPPEVGRLTQLVWLDLSSNPLQTLPAKVGQLTNVKHLDLSHCHLDTLPPEVWRLTQLEWLNLSSNPLQTLPVEIGQLINVKHLDLSNCQLHTLPPEVGRLTQLEWLDLRSNPLQTLPAEIGQLSNVKHLDLSHCELSTLPPEVGRLAQLEWLDLRSNPLQTLPAEIGQLTNVKHLDLWNCQLHTLPPEVGRLTQLEWLNLRSNPLQTLPAEIGQLTNVKHLDLWNCQLHTLPPEVGRLTQLEWLDLRSNPLQTLPAEIGQLTNVKHLDLWNCQLHTLPPEVWRLTQLEWLALRFNPLLTLPAEIGQLTNVKHLDLSQCQLRTLPPELWRLTKLEWLNLRSNPLQTLPAEVGQLTNLSHLDVNGNPLIKPPPEVSENGIVAIRQYFEELERSEEDVSAHLKVVVLGETKAGKTSLVRTLRRWKSTLTEEEDRTHCVEVTQWKADDSITFEVYDFGGHDVYHLTHQFFLTPDALYLLLVNIENYNCTEKSYSEAVGFWLDTLNARVPGAVVSLVGTKIDLCLPDDVHGKTCDIQERLKVQTDMWLAGLSSDRLEPVLSYLQQVGTVLRYTDIPELTDFVFHDPSALIEIFKDVFHHDVKELFATPRLQKTTYTSVQLGGFEQDLRDCGLIQKDVLTSMLPPNIDPDIILALMQHFGLCYELKTDPSKHICHYKIPWYLHKQMPELLKTAWPEDVLDDKEQLQLMCDIRGFCPRGLFQRFSVGTHPLVEDRTDWKDGFMAYIQDYPVLVCSKPAADDTYITMATRGSLSQADEMWGVVHPLLEVLVQLLQEWPGVPYSLHVTCAHCIKAGLDNPHQYDLRDRTADDGRDVRCPRVMHTASTSAELVYRPGRFPKKPSEGKPVVLLIIDEFGTSKGGISTINGQLMDILTHDDEGHLTSARAKVVCTVLHATDEEKREAQSQGIELVVPSTLEGDQRTPTLDWLTYDHKTRYPDIPSDISVIVGHADVTSTAARNIKKKRLPASAKFILYNHVMPEDTEHHKSDDRVMSIGDKMDAIRADTEEADAVFSVGPTMHDYYKTQIGLSKPHHLFLPRPSDIFSRMNVTYVETKTKTVLSVGRVRGVEKLKGYDLLVKAMGKVLDRFPKARLRIRGVSAEDFPESKEIIQANIAKGTFHFTPLKYGTQYQLSRDFREAHLVLMPSRAEPFGLVGLEAIAAGVPVLVSSNSGLAEFLESKGPDFDRPIVDMDGSDEVVAERLAKRIIKVLTGGPAEFEAAKRLKDKLLASKYWEESHRTFLEECGIRP